LSRSTLLLVALLSHFLAFSPQAKATHAKSIRVATYLEPPMVDFVDGHFVGENIEVAKLLAKKLDKDIYFIRCPIARCLSMIEKGHADMILSLRKTQARQQYMTYLTPPFKVQHFPLRFYVLKERKLEISKFEDLNALSVGVVRGAAYFDRFDQDKSINKVEVTGHRQLIQMLLKSRIDTFLEREETIIPLIEAQVYQSKITLAQYQFDKSVDSYIAISKKSSFHKDIGKMSEQLTLMIKSGEIQQLLKDKRVPDLSRQKNRQ